MTSDEDCRRRRRNIRIWLRSIYLHASVGDVYATRSSSDIDAGSAVWVCVYMLRGPLDKSRMAFYLRAWIKIFVAASISHRAKCWRHNRSDSTRLRTVGHLERSEFWRADWAAASSSSFDDRRESTASTTKIAAAVAAFTPCLGRLRSVMNRFTPFSAQYLPDDSCW